MNIRNHFSISTQKTLLLIKLILILLVSVQLLGCGAPAKGMLFSDYINSSIVQNNDATIVVYREYQAGGLGIPIYLNHEVAGTLLPKGYLALTVPALKEHILYTKNDGLNMLDIKTAVTLKPGSIQYLKWDLLNIPFAYAKSELVKVGEKVAVEELKLSRNSIE